MGQTPHGCVGGIADREYGTGVDGGHTGTPPASDPPTILMEPYERV